MNDVRINELYNALAEVNVRVAQDPRTLGSGYVAKTIKDILDATEAVNAIYVEVCRALTATKNDLRIRQLEWEERLNAKILAPEIRELEVSYQEKLARARRQIEHEYQTEHQQTSTTPTEGNTQTVQTPTTLGRELVDLENTSLSLTLLKKAIEEKKAYLKQADSAVRLQNQAIETEMRAFGSVPTGQTQETTRRTRRRDHQLVRNPEQWQSLTGSETENASNPTTE